LSPNSCAFSTVPAASHASTAPHRTRRTQPLGAAPCMRLAAHKLLWPVVRLICAMCLLPKKAHSGSRFCT
jgi:hypothetical protein